MLLRYINSSFMFSVLSQVANSGASFLFTIFLAGVLSKTEFGFYGVAFSASFLLAGIGNSLVHTQMAVNFFSKPDGDRDLYLKQMLFGLIFLLAGVWVIYELSVFALFYVGYINKSWVGGGVGFSMLAFSLKDYLVRVFYTRQNPQGVLFINLVFCFSLCFTGLILYFYAGGRTANFALAAFGFSNLIAFVCGLPRLDFHKNCNLGAKNIFRELRGAFNGGGGWYLCVTCATALQSQFYTFFVAGKIGLDEVAVMNAARIFLMPPIVLIPVFNQVYLPRFIQSSKVGGCRDLNRAIGFLLGLFGVYFVVIISCHEILFSKLVPWKAGNLFNYLLAWAFSVFVMIIKSGVLIQNHAEKKFKQLFFINAFGCLVCVIFSYGLIHVCGGPGAILALAISDLAIWYMFRYLIFYRK